MPPNNGILSMAALLAWTAALSSTQPLARVPDREFSGGGVTILSHNDLSNKPAPGSAAVLVHQPSSYQAAENACRRLGETLWSPESGVFADGLNNSLSYQIYQGVFPRSQRFWVSKDASGDCRSIAYTACSRGAVEEADCEGDDLPALCTQSAPVSTFDTNNDPTEFVVNQLAGDGLVYKGFRDFFVWKFRGVRFAATPGRFEYARRYEPTVEDRKAPIPALDAVGDCVQRVGEVTSGSTEDCLFLNIWTPYLPPSPPNVNTPTPKLKPVMLYIYGGGFTSGSWKNPNTDGTMLASRGDVVVVSVNYRVGSFGWLAFDDGIHRGNYGISDLVVALEWVRDNIGYFGGDKDRVTIFGESAGAVLVRALMASPRAKGLFYAAISQSGPAGIWDNDAGLLAYYQPVASAWDKTTKPLLQALGCPADGNAATCVRALDATRVSEADPQATNLVVDGEFLVADTLALNGTREGEEDTYTGDVALITGINRDENGIFFPGPPPPGVDAGEFLVAVFGGLFTSEYARQALAALAAVSRHPLFAPPENATPEQVLSAAARIATDVMYTCAEQATAATAARHGAFGRGVWAYRFNRTYGTPYYSRPHCDAADPGRDDYMKCHGAEQLVVFGTWARGGLVDRDGRDLGFTQRMVDRWAAFGRTRQPNVDEGEMRARGLWGSWMGEMGRWEEVGTGGLVRVLQAEEVDGGWVEREQCELLGQGLGMFEPRV